jgi:hypothetical protein
VTDGHGNGVGGLSRLDASRATMRVRTAPAAAQAGVERRIAGEPAAERERLGVLDLHGHSHPELHYALGPCELAARAGSQMIRVVARQL